MTIQLAEATPDDEGALHVWLHLPPENCTITIHLVSEDAPAPRLVPAPAWDTAAQEAERALGRLGPRAAEAVAGLRELGCGFIAPRALGGGRTRKNYVRFAHPSGAAGYLYPGYFKFLRRRHDRDVIDTQPGARVAATITTFPLAGGAGPGLAAVRALIAWHGGEEPQS
jgi:hypothetical protein